MRALRLTLPAILLLVASAPTGALAAAGDDVFGGIKVHTIDIQFSQAAWWDSLVQYYNDGNEQYMAATVTLDGEVLDSVGVRLKGNASYSHPNNKKPFRLAFDQYRDEQRWDGLKGVHLNNCWEDPTFLREKLHLDFCRDAGVPAPRGNFAELYLNGERWGFYSLEEHVNKTFLASWYGDDSGDLYKAVDGLLLPTVSDFKWYGSDPGAYTSRYELKTEESPAPWTDLIAVIDSLNNAADPAASLPPVVNLSSVERGFATDILLANLDSYSGSGRNFYVYFNPLSGKMEWACWDAGMSFGSYWSAATNYETLDISYVKSATDRPLAGKIHSTAALQSTYLQAFCSLATKYFTTGRLLAQIDTLANRVRPYVYADPRKMYTNEQFETNLTSDITVGGHRKPGLKSFVTARRASVTSQLAALGLSCSATAAVGDLVLNEFATANTAILDPAGDAEDWIELYNTTGQAIPLDGLYLSNSAGAPTLWPFPVGTTIAAHGFLIVWADGEPSESGLHATFTLAQSGGHVRLSNPDAGVLDSVSYGAQTTDLTMARVPNGTGAFRQVRPTFAADNGSGNYAARGEVVINEFMADNDSIPDPAGETDDWLELYNATSHAVALGGLYLADSYSTPTKWQIPDGVSIPAGGYLVVWADEDLGQEGVHANWKLSASGERILLSNGDLSVVDSVSFGVQRTNAAMARIPDGTGAFTEERPTPGAMNVATVAAEPGLGPRVALAQNAPNPFTRGTVIAFAVARAGRVALRVFDVSGRRVATLVDRDMQPGNYLVELDATGLASGLYFYRLYTADAIVARRMLLLK